jgi:hypothetical protein
VREDIWFRSHPLQGSAVDSRDSGFVVNQKSLFVVNRVYRVCLGGDILQEAEAAIGHPGVGGKGMEKFPVNSGKDFGSGVIFPVGIHRVKTLTNVPALAHEVLVGGSMLWLRAVLDQCTESSLNRMACIRHLSSSWRGGI